MNELSEKYVFHIPLYKYVDEELVLIELDCLLDNLIDEFAKNGFDSLYMTKVKSYYKSRFYDEILVTIFSSKEESPLEIFEKWFRKNNHILGQESFGYEHANNMIISQLKKV